METRKRVLSPDIDVTKVLRKMAIGDEKYFSAKVPRSHECIRAKASYLKNRGEGTWSCESGMDYMKITRLE